MATREDQLGALASLGGAPAGGGPMGGGLEAFAGGGQEQVLCTVCDTLIDTVTGEPLEPVGLEKVDAVRSYLTTAGQAEEGGVALV